MLYLHTYFIAYHVATDIRQVVFNNEKTKVDTTTNSVTRGQLWGGGGNWWLNLKKKDKGYYGQSLPYIQVILGVKVSSLTTGVSCHNSIYSDNKSNWFLSFYKRNLAFFVLFWYIFQNKFVTRTTLSQLVTLENNGSKCNSPSYLLQ